MGAIWKQQGSLKIDKTQGLIERDKLVEGAEYAFKKDGHRLFMLETPIELITSDWQAIARIMITEFTVGHSKTKGIYKILKVYSDEEVRVVSGTLIPYSKTQKR